MPHRVPLKRSAGLAMISIAALLLVDLYVNVAFFDETVFLPIQAAAALGLGFFGLRSVQPRALALALAKSLGRRLGAVSDARRIR